MHCRFSERHLDAYVEGTLGPRQRALVSAHLASCARCAALVDEFRSIDALLLSPRKLEPAENFTFKVMAEARAIAGPRRSHVPPARVIVSYLIFAWCSNGVFFRFGDGAARGAWSALRESLAQSGENLNALSRVTAHVLGPNTLRITTAMSALILLDVALLIAVAVLAYAFRRRATASVRIAR